MKNWKKVKLGSLLVESKILSEQPNTDKRIRVKLNVLGVEKRPVTKDKKGATKYYVRKTGQFVYGKQNLHKGAFGIIPEELNGFESSLDIPAFDISEDCYPEWIFYFFKKGNFYLKLEKLAKGVGSKRIDTKLILELDIYLPTKEEQRKVLDEIEKAEANNQELVKEIKTQEESLNKLRQSIIQDAVKGKLTQEWRNQNPTVETAKCLLNKIKAEKEQLIKDKKIKREKPIPPIITDEIPFEIPENWEWCRMQDVGLFERGRSKYRPRNDFKLFTSEGGYPFVQTGDVSKAKYNEGIIISHNKNYSEFGLKQSRLWAKNTLCITIAANIAETGFLSYDACFPDSVVGFTSLTNLSTSKFVQYFIDITKSDLEKYAPSTAQKNINLGILYILKFPLPPIEEQKEIVKKVTRFLSNCDNLEKAILDSKENSEKLIHAVLIELLGDEKNVLVNMNSIKKIKDIPSREVKYNSKTTLMDLVKLLHENGKLHAEDLWKMSEYPDDIDAFYAELKKQIEQEKTIKESNEKGYLELT